MKKFADLNLRSPIDDLSKVEKMISRSSELGYRLVGISLPPSTTQKGIHQLRKICDHANVDLVTRLDLAPKTPKELLYDLRRYRRAFEILSVKCNSKTVARQAAKDRRVDLLSFSVTNLRRRYFDRAEAELASNALTSLEIEMVPLLSLKGLSRIRLLSSLRKESMIAKRSDVPIVISSGATNEYLMRPPHDYAALAGLFELTRSDALHALSEAPVSIVDRNRKKLSPKYVAPGIHVVKEENCCRGV